MILGISSFTYGWSISVAPDNGILKPMSETDLVKITRAFDLHCLQVGDNLPLHTFSEDRLHHLRSLIQEHKIRLEIGARKLTPEHLQRYIELAEFFDAPLLRFIIDGDQYEPDIHTVRTLLKDFLPELKKRNLTLGIENHDRLKAKELAHLMESIDSPSVGICLDCVNSMGAGEGLEYVATLLAPFTVNLHIKDFNAERLPHKMGFTITGAPVGKGLCDISLIMEKLQPYNRCHSAVLEQWVPPAELLSTTIEKEQTWAAEGIQYLKHLPYFLKKEY